ncbi:YqaA family protein [Paenibacillus yanchengensis]|uniref:YqaA family protein n=1 Tax=Paenibacillus yanchengensis TaxID=2035833 RepID=A0ABW4YI34_9BACL
MIQAVVDFLRDFGPWGLFIHSFFDAIIFPIPAFFSQVSLSLVNPSNAIVLATIGYIACLLGTPIGYLIGKLMGKSVLYKILKKEWIDAATDKFQKNGETAILLGSFTPIPFKVFTILSGCLNFPLWKLLAYAAMGRAVKFYAVGILFYLYGRAAENMVQDVSLYMFLAGIPIVLIFLLVRRVIRKRKAAKAALDSASESTKQSDMASASKSTEVVVDIATVNRTNQEPLEEKKQSLISEQSHTSRAK